MSRAYFDHITLRVSLVLANDIDLQDHMMQHSSGFSFPSMGPGAVTEDPSERHAKMMANKQAATADTGGGGSHGVKLLNNLFCEDPSSDSRGWGGMFRHGNRTFTNKHSCGIPCHAV